ncbi:hypothetical protein Tco_0610501 [Tanacetum coccineum]
MTTLAEYMILSGADNRPPMLDKDLYDSWKSIMELYMQNREHERMILESVEHGPLIWPTIEENRVTRTKKYVELFVIEKLQADCDMKAINIILQGPFNHSQISIEAFRRWCATPLSTLYPLTTSESSSGDSLERPLHSSSPSAGPSRKRCRSPVDSVPSSTPVMESLAPTRAELLPPHKRLRDSYSSEASIEEDTEIDPIETKVDMELGVGDGDDVRDHVEIDPRDVRDDT